MVQTNQISSDYGKYIQLKSDKIPFIGSRAIFDTNFVPPVILPREKQTTLLKGTLHDALEDGYSTNINIYGLKGVGKNLLVNHYLSWLGDQQHTLQKETDNDNCKTDCNQFLIIRIDCDQKEVEQIFFAIIDQLKTKLNIKMSLNQIAGYSSAKLWNLIRILVEKSQNPILLYLQKSENLPPTYLNKIYKYAKSLQKLQIITGMNTGSQRYAFRQYEGMDHRILLDVYEVNELHQITEDRSIMAFKQALNPEAVDLMVDYICEFDLKVPGSCIHFLRELYPVIQQTGELSSENIRDVSQYYFEDFKLDAITMADFVVKTEIEDRLFLEYLVNYFQQKEKFYIPFADIQNAYQMTSEELGFKPTKKEFNHMFRKITQADILRPGLYYKSLSTPPINGIYHVPHFLTLPLEEVNEIMEFSFGMMDSEFENE